MRYCRYIRLRLLAPHVVTEGLVFLGRRTEIYARKHHGRIILGAWTHIGDGSAIRCHEGTLRIGPKTVLGCRDTVNCFLDIEIGQAALIADDVYICDFDHVTDDVNRPIKDQGIVKTPVRIGAEVWLGTKVAILRGARVGRGAVLGAHSVARGEIPPYSVAVGVPARVVRSRLDPRQHHPR